MNWTFFQGISVRVGRNVPTRVLYLFKDTDYALCATFKGPTVATAAESVDLPCTSNIKGKAIIIQKSSPYLTLQEIRANYGPIQRKKIAKKYSFIF